MARLTSSASNKRQRRLVLGKALAVGVVGVFLLVVRGVQQQQLGQRLGGRRRIHRPAKAVLHEPRQVADVIDVRVRQHHGVDLRGIERQPLPVPQPQLL